MSYLASLATPTASRARAATAFAARTPPVDETFGEAHREVEASARAARPTSDTQAERSTTEPKRAQRSVAAARDAHPMPIAMA